MLFIRSRIVCIRSTVCVCLSCAIALIPRFSRRVLDRKLIGVRAFVRTQCAAATLHPSPHSSPIKCILATIPISSHPNREFNPFGTLNLELQFVMRTASALGTGNQREPGSQGLQSANQKQQWCRSPPTCAHCQRVTGSREWKLFSYFPIATNSSSHKKKKKSCECVALSVLTQVPYQPPNSCSLHLALLVVRCLSLLPILTN